MRKTAKNTNQTTTKRDLERLAKKITMLRKRANCENRVGGDIDMAEACTQDAKDLAAIHKMIAAGKLAKAGNAAYDLDTAARDEIPIRLFNTIMAAAGFCN